MKSFDKRWFSVAKQASFSTTPLFVGASVSVPEPETSALTNSAYAKKMRRKRESKNATAAEVHDPPRSPTRKLQDIERVVFHTHVGEADRKRLREASPPFPVSFRIAADGTLVGLDLASGQDFTAVAIVKHLTSGIDRKAPSFYGSPHAPADAPEYRREYLCGPLEAEEPPRGAGGLPRR